jgi:hypothetical protein
VDVTWRCLITESTTGLVVDELALAADPDWSTEIGAKGSWSADVLLGTGPNTKDTVLSYLTSGRYAWIIVYNNTPIQGGMPASGGYVQKTRTLTATGSGILALFDNRTVRTANGTPATIASSVNNLTIGNATKRRVIRDLIGLSLADTNSGAGLPFDLTDAATETGSENRVFPASDFTSFVRRLNDESDDNQGPEFIIRPYLVQATNQTFVAWQLAIGTPLLGDQNLAAVWELSAAFGDIDIDYNMAVPIPHRVWAKGAGDGPVTVIGYAENSAALQAAKIPYADYVDTSHTEISDKAKLDSFAAATLAERSVPTETWHAMVRVDGKNTQGVQISPELGSWVEGDQPLFRVTKHQVIPDGSYRRRIVGMSKGETPGTVALKIKPTPLA